MVCRAQNAHEKAASDLERNIGIANNKTTHHKEMQEDHKTKMASKCSLSSMKLGSLTSMLATLSELESFRHTKEAHDVCHSLPGLTSHSLCVVIQHEREQKLAAHKPAASSS